MGALSVSSPTDARSTFCGPAALGTSENCPVEINYPINVTRVSGDVIQNFNPTSPDSSQTFSWVFSQNGEERGGQFSVSVSGWAVGFNTTSYTNQTDELFGAARMTIDNTVVTFRGPHGNVIAALGDQGNLFLASSLSEWEPNILSSSSGETLICNGSAKVVGKLSDIGVFEIAGCFHSNMDDTNDTCSSGTEGDYLDNEISPSIRLKDSQRTTGYAGGK